MRNTTTIWITVLAGSLLLAIGMTLALLLFWPRVLESWNSGPAVSAPLRVPPSQSAPQPITATPSPPAPIEPDDEVDDVEEDWNDPTDGADDMEPDDSDAVVEEDSADEDEDI